MIKDSDYEVAFLKHVNKTETCWLWTGSKSSGYGDFSCKGTRHLAHRAAYFMWKTGLMEGNNEIMHTCDVKLCVNPDHLQQGSHKENIQDCVSKGRNNPPIGERQGRVKLNEQAVKVIKYMRKHYKTSVNKLAEIYNVDQSTVSLIVNNKNWKHIIVN